MPSASILEISTKSLALSKLLNRDVCAFSKHHYSRNIDVPSASIFEISTKSLALSKLLRVTCVNFSLTIQWIYGLDQCNVTQPVAGDVSAPTSMKNVVKRDMYCDLQSSWVIEFLNACCARGKSHEHVCLSVCSTSINKVFDMYFDDAQVLSVLGVPLSSACEKWSL